MIYAPDEELKARKKCAGLTDRDFANAIGRSPSAVSRMLNGFMPMSATDRLKMLVVCDKAEEGKDGNNATN